MNKRYLKLLEEVMESKSEPLHKHSRVLIIDGLNTFIRSYAASPVTNNDGVHVGGITGFLMSVGSAIKTINPTQVIVVFDGKNGSSRRRQVYPDYKAKRKVKIRLNRGDGSVDQDNQLQQLVRLITYLETLPFKVITIENTEADDVIAYLASDYFKDKGTQAYIMSSDKDFFQLVNDDIHIWSPTKKKLYFTQDVQEELGLPPQNVAIYKALVGDSSDNIPGVQGVGLKSLLKCLPDIGTTPMTVDQFLDYTKQKSEESKGAIYKKILQSEGDFRLYYSIVQLATSNINTASKLRIIDLVQNEINKTQKATFYKLLTEDRMLGAIKNPDMWLREITQKLDMFTT
jgi:5'-3' exonuclease